MAFPLSKRFPYKYEEILPEVTEQRWISKETRIVQKVQMENETESSEWLKAAISPRVSEESPVTKFLPEA